VTLGCRGGVVAADDEAVLADAERSTTTSKSPPSFTQTGEPHHLPKSLPRFLLSFPQIETTFAPMFGAGLLKGMVETARNFVGSYHDPERLPTVQYPEQQRPLPENARSFPMLIYDGNDPEKGLRCVACKICEKECPPQCIYIILERDERGKPMKRPKVFDLDIAVCMSCQICVEVCPFDSIKMDNAFELSADDRFDGLLLRKHDLAKSNEYYRRIHPTEAAETDARLAAEKAKAEAKEKARAKAAPAAPATATT
jgi:NADH-quinone oxidoreductase subunit I